MADRYTKLYIQIVFAVKYRKGLLDKTWREGVFKYITGIVQRQGHLLIAINGVEDHVHILVAMRPHQSLSDLVRDIKSCSSKWINERNFLSHPFQWQRGFGAFSYTPEAVPNVIRYINNQEAHHQKVYFDKEYKEMLEQYNIDYKEQYLFKLED